jgi:hypothetical protein
MRTASYRYTAMFVIASATGLSARATIPIARIALAVGSGDAVGQQGSWLAGRAGSLRRAVSSSCPVAPKRAKLRERRSHRDVAAQPGIVIQVRYGVNAKARTEVRSEALEGRARLQEVTGEARKHP